MKDIYQGPVYHYLINENINNKRGWGGHGGSVDATTPEKLQGSKTGTTFIREFMLEHKPYNIVETGTNYGSFSYLCYETLEDFRLWTCDNHPNNQSQRCIDYINQHYQKNNVTYKNVNSVDFLQELKQQNFQVDLAWLDSSHNYDCLSSELHLVADLKPKFIMVDDFWMYKSLQTAVFDFLKDTNYRFYAFSNVRNWVGSVVILRLSQPDDNFRD